jgi:3-isopropylmalate dehydrogenase
MDDRAEQPRTYRIAVVPGDGIGPEVIREGLKVLREALAKSGAPECAFVEVAAGAALYRDTGVAFPEDSRTTCAEADAVFLGATGLPEVRLPDGTGVSIAWELRKSLALFAAVRPVRLFHADHCPLKGKAAGQVRLTIVRENTEGIYASRWAGTTLHDEVAVNPIVITRRATERIVRCAFDLARRGPGAPGDGRRRVTCVDKSNVLACWALFRKVFHEIGAEYPEIEKDTAYIDAMTVHLVRQPERFDVVVTENQHGDILSDLCAALVGGLGFAPSANLGAHRGMFEPSHGTAPDIAGKALANPVATILTGALMLNWLAAEHGDARLAAAAERIEGATARVLVAGRMRTADIGGTATTSAMGDAIAEAL